MKKNDFDISDVQDVLGLAPKKIQNVNVLRDIRVRLQPVTFIDKCIIAAKYRLELNNKFTSDYFVGLHHITSTPGRMVDAGGTILGLGGGWGQSK